MAHDTFLLCLACSSLSLLKTDLLRRFSSRLSGTSDYRLRLFPRIFVTPCYAIRYTTYSKMFVGGLNWDTTDGIHIRMHNQFVLLTISMRCVRASP